MARNGKTTNLFILIMTLDEARNKLPLDLLMAHLGHTEAAKPKAKSPFRDDKTPSFGIYRSQDGRLRWKDHATGEGGDEVDYLAQFYELSPADAQKKYMELAGGNTFQPAPEQPTGKYRMNRKGTQPAPTEAEHAPKAPPVFDWQAYVARADGAFLEKIALERVVDIATFNHIHSLGILGATLDGEPAFIVNGGSAAHYRVADGSWRYTAGGKAAVPLTFGCSTSDEAWVFESQWDAIAILDKVGLNKLDAVQFVVTRGANNGKNIVSVCDGKKLTAFPQNDSVKGNGKVPSDEWLADVKSCSKHCRVVEIPKRFKDANDWTEVTDSADVVRVVNSATLPELAGIEFFKVSDLMKFVPKSDATCLLGDRWLCRGGSALIVGPAGIGKSSLAAQFAVLWALGLPACGIMPKRPLKSVLVQAENDEGDMAEMLQGVFAYASRLAAKAGILSSDCADLIRKNVIVARDTIHSGDSFAEAATAIAESNRDLDLFWCDPLLSYVGDDISSQKVASNFLRGKLNPISFKYGFAWMCVHHTGKPPGDAKARQKWTDTDFSYIGLGSSELTNWARACLYLEALDDGLFALRLTKRGKRAGVCTLSGLPITKIGLQHGEGAIFWEPAELPEPGEKTADPSNLQLDEAFTLHRNGSSLREIIANLELKGSKGTPMSPKVLAQKLARFERKK
jgi:hypothetical protein